jgi:cytochrome c biogenesis protein CcdA
VIRLIGIAISIGLADSLNPSTIAPALFLASGDRPRDTVFKFTLGVFAVYFGGGVVIALGPGQLLLSLLPHPSHDIRHILEVIAGAVMLAAGALLWRHRDSLQHKDPPTPDVEGRSSLLLGAGITAVELPTAFPYFAVIAAIVGSDQPVLSQVLLLLLFNLCFVLPLGSIYATLWVFGEGAEQVLTRARDFLQRHWPVLLASVALIAGTFVILLGATGIAAKYHGKFGRFARHFRHFLPGG